MKNIAVKLLIIYSVTITVILADIFANEIVDINTFKALQRKAFIQSFKLEAETGFTNNTTYSDYYPFTLPKNKRIHHSFADYAVVYVTSA